MEKQYNLLGYIILALIPLTFAGFYASYIGQIPHFSEKIRLAHHFHAAISSLWIVMLITQPLLIRYNKLQAHRLIGKLSYFLFALLIFSFLPLIHADSILLFPIADMSMLILFFTLAVINRKDTQKHMRYMIAFALVFMDPTLGRTIFRMAGSLGYNTIAVHHITLGIISSIILALIFFDKANKRNYTPYIVSLSCFLVYQIAFYVIYVR
jgi:hypothetical protein